MTPGTTIGGATPGMIIGGGVTAGGADTMDTGNFNLEPYSIHPEGRMNPNDYRIYQIYFK